MSSVLRRGRSGRSQNQALRLPRYRPLCDYPAEPAARDRATGPHTTTIQRSKKLGVNLAQ